MPNSIKATRELFDPDRYVSTFGFKAAAFVAVQATAFFMLFFLEPNKVRRCGASRVLIGYLLFLF